MVHRRWLSCLFAACAAVLILGSPIDGRAAKPEPLKVLSVHPTGKIPRLKQITVTFSQPMVPLGDMERAADAVPVSVDPALDGRFRWLNVYTLAFELTTPLEGSFAGSITVKRTARSVSGARLAADVKTDFSLPPIQLLRSLPEDQQTGLPLRPRFQLFFNQPLLLPELQNLAYVAIPPDGRIPCTATVEPESNRDRQPGGEWAVVLIPNQDLPPDTPVELVLPAGLASAGGPRPSPEEMRLHYRTYGPFQVREITGYRPQEGAPLDPESGLQIRFTNPLRPKDLMGRLKITPDYDLTRIEGVEDAEAEPVSELWLPGPFKASTVYTFAFDPSLTDAFGQPLQGPTSHPLPLGPARPVLELPGRKGVLETTSAATYPFRVRNISQVHLRGRLLAPDDVVPFVMKHEMFSYLDESEDDFLADAPPYDVKTARIHVDVPAEEMTYQPVKLNDVFGKDIGPGLIYFDLSASETDNPKTGRPIYRRALVQVTDVGLSAKFGQSNTLIWATSLSTGKPLANVQLEIRNGGNHVLWRGESDQEGLAMAPGAAQFKIQKREGRYDEPLLFVMAQQEGQFSFLSTEWNEGIAPWNFGLPTRDLDEGEEAMTWVLTALPLYKPGDDVRFKIIQRLNTSEGLTLPDAQALVAEVQDSRGKTLEKLQLTMTQFGTASGGLRLPPTAPLGTYSILVGPTDKKLAYSGSFQVQAYRKPTFAVDVQPAVESALAGDAVHVGVGARYHFGSPVVEQPVDYVVTASPEYFSLPRLEDYSVVDWYGIPEDEAEPVPTITSGRVNLDDQGRAALNFQALPAKRPQPRSFQVEVTVTDVDQRTVSQRRSVLVHPASIYVGLKTTRLLVGPGEKMTVNLIAAAPDGRLIPDVTTDLALYRRTWQTVRRKGVGGYYHYISTPTDTLVQRVRTKTLARPMETDFTVAESGFYYVSAAAKDSAGRPAAASVGFYAYGQGAAGWQHYDHDRIDLIADKKEYRPGDTATLLIQSPFTQATGLLTVERNGVRRHQVFNVDSAAPAVQVPIEAGDSPNVFVSVVLVRGRISDQLDRQGRDPGKPAFKAGYAQLRVLDEQSKLIVEVEPDRAQARPGEDVELTVKVRDGAGLRQQTEVALIVADAALLQLATEDAYFPDRIFFAPRSLAVWTADSRLNLIGRRHYGLKGAAPGGGGLEESSGSYRRRFVSLALFEPHVLTDGSGTARVKFRLPDNLTTFKIFAVANTAGGKFGTGLNTLQVTKPLLLQSGLPNFAGVGDEFTANVVVHNRSRQGGRVTVTLSGDNFEMITPQALVIDLNANASREVGFPVRILPGTEAVFRFDAALDGETDAAEFHIPVRFPNPLTTSATFGRLTQSAKETVLIPKDADPARGGLALTVSPSLVGGFVGAFDHLKTYPYDCLEQQASRALGDLLYREWKVRLETRYAADPNLDGRIRAFLDGLPAFQSYDGGFSFWPQTNRTDPYLSAYVLQVLTLARNLGHSVDMDAYRQGLEYLSKTLNHNKWPRGYSPDDAQTARAYMILVLAEAERKVAPLVENLYTDREKLQPFELACLLQTLALSGRDEQVLRQTKDIQDRLFGRAVITSREVHFEEKDGALGLMASRIRTNAFALRALLKAAPDSPHVLPLANWLANAQRNGHWGTTQNNAVALLALTDYLLVMEQEPPNFNLQAVVNYEPIAAADFRSFDTPPLERTLMLRDLPLGQKVPVGLGLQGTGAAYYAIRLDYAAKDPDFSDQQAGFTVSRAYTRLDRSGEPVVSETGFRRGDIVQVDLTLLVPNQRHWVVLEDRLPAGLEPINFELATAPQNLQALLDEGHRPEEYYRRYWYEHREIRSDRVAVFARVLPEGAYTFSYLTRAVTPGVFVAPGPHVEEMYAPETSGRGAGMRLEVKTD